MSDDELPRRPSVRFEDKVEVETFDVQTLDSQDPELNEGQVQNEAGTDSDKDALDAIRERESKEAMNKESDMSLKSAGSRDDAINSQTEITGLQDGVAENQDGGSEDTPTVAIVKASNSQNEAAQDGDSKENVQDDTKLLPIEDQASRTTLESTDDARLQESGSALEAEGSTTKVKGGGKGSSPKVKKRKIGKTKSADLKELGEKTSARKIPVERKKSGLKKKRSRVLGSNKQSKVDTSDANKAADDVTELTSKDGADSATADGGEPGGGSENLEPEPEGEAISAEVEAAQPEEEVKEPDPLDDPELQVGEMIDMAKFTDIVNKYVDIFSEDRYLEVSDEYPTEDVVKLVTMVTTMLGRFEEFMGATQQNIETLRTKMRRVKENIHASVSRMAMHIREDTDEPATIEERELTEKLATLNATCAKTNVDVAEAVHLSSETEKFVVETQLLTEKARDEARWIEMELERKARAEAKRKAEEEKRLADEKMMEDEARRKKQEHDEDVKKQELKRKESLHINMEEADEWPIYEYPTEDSLVIVKGHPEDFDRSSIRFRVLKPNTTEIPFDDPNEELVSQIINLYQPPSRHNDPVSFDVYLAIPHCIRRGAAASREPVMKMRIDTTWIELPTSEVMFENQKDKKFAQAEVRMTGTFIVTSKFRRDYISINRHELNLTSSYDQRVKIAVPDRTFSKEQTLILTVIPVDLASVNEFRSWGSQNKKLFASSSIICTDWENQKMKKEIMVTMPCPSNPAKARKMALIRKLKEEKMNQPHYKVPIEFDDKKEKGKKKKQEKAEEFVSIRSQPKWYMGDYAASDDDDTDVIYLLAVTNGKWIALPDVEINQKKAEQVTFKLSRCYERFVVVRFRTTVCKDTAALLFSALQETLSYRYARVIFRQHHDEQYNAMIYVVPDHDVDKVCGQLDERGYTKGAPTSQRICLAEGDEISVKFRGNIRCEGNKQVELRYHSNLRSRALFALEEVDRYRQKNFGEHKGVMEISRLCVAKMDGAQQEPEVKTSFLCDLYISLPRYEVDQGGQGETILFRVLDPLDCVNDDLLHKLSNQLGKEWQQLALYLGLTHERVQAVLRNMQAYEQSESEAKYNMLLTWFKRSRKFEEKVTPLKHALLQCGRTDLAELVYDLELEFHVERFYKESPEKRESIPPLPLP